MVKVGSGGGAFGAIQNGRDHNPFPFTMWLSGGRVKGGTIYGATDATILHLMVIDHTKLTHRDGGRDFRLTDVEGKVIRDIIA